MCLQALYHRLVTLSLLLTFTCMYYYFIEWAESDVIERFLKPIGMEFMAKAFLENKICGPVLMCLTEEHMKEMGCAVLGKYM